MQGVCLTCAASRLWVGIEEFASCSTGPATARVWLRWLLLPLVVASRAALALDALDWLAVLEVDAAVHAPGGQPGLMPACFRTGQPLVDYATSILARC
jgi:hypothetical protein